MCYKELIICLVIKRVLRIPFQFICYVEKLSTTTKLVIIIIITRLLPFNTILVE